MKNVKKIAKEILTSVRYKTLNDAGTMPPWHEPGLDVDLTSLEKGNTEIWYQTFEFFKSHSGGLKEEVFNTIDLNNLEKTHVLLGSVKERNLNKIFRIMQSDYWSPLGEANNLIRSKSLSHTSMSVGDIIKISNNVYIVAMLGFKKLANSWTQFKGTRLPAKAVEFIKKDEYSRGSYEFAYFKGDDAETATDWIIVTNTGGFYKVDAIYMIWHTDGRSFAAWSDASLRRIIKALLKGQHPPQDPDYQT